MERTIEMIKDYIRKNKEIMTFSLMAVCVISMVLLMYKIDLSSKVLRYASHISNQNETQIVHDFTNQMEIKQKFTCYSDFDFISLYFADHDQRYSGKIAVFIKDVERAESIIYKEIDMMDIFASKPVEISFEEIGGGKANKLYEISLISYAADEKALGVLGYNSEEEPAIINGEKSEYALSIGIHSYTALYSKISKLIIIIGIFVVIGTTLCTLVLKWKEEYLFLWIAIPFVLFMVMLWPGNEVYDEGTHYYTVYYYSNKLLGIGDHDNFNKIMMRECDLINEDEVQETEIPVNGQAQKYYYFVEKLWDKVDSYKEIEIDISKSPVVPDGTFIQYTPGIIGMSLARILKFNFFSMMTITRLAIIASYLGLCYYAISVIPTLKTVVAFVAALPINLYQASGISYDSFTFAVGIVVFAFIIRLWKNGLECKEWIILGVFTFILGNCKGGVYLTLILLMCFIPREKYKNKKWVKFVGILTVAAGSMMVSFLPTIRSWIFQSVARNEGVVAPSIVINSGGMVAPKLSPMFVLTNPIEFFEMFLRTMFNNLDIYLGQILGYRTAWSNKPIQLVVLLPFLILLIFAVIKSERDDLIVEFSQKAGMLGILIAELVGMQAIFLMETSIYSETIIGFQGRYFVPFLPYILLLFRKEGIVFKEKKEYLYPLYSMGQLFYLYFFLEMFMIH